MEILDKDSPIRSFPLLRRKRYSNVDPVVNTPTGNPYLMLSKKANSSKGAILEVPHLGTSLKKLLFQVKRKTTIHPSIPIRARPRLAIPKSEGSRIKKRNSVNPQMLKMEMLEFQRKPKEMQREMMPSLLPKLPRNRNKLSRPERRYGNI